MDRAGFAQDPCSLHGRVPRGMARALRIAALSAFIAGLAVMTFLESALTLLIQGGPDSYTGEDSDYAAWRAFMPWTIGLWIVAVALVVHRVRRRRSPVSSARE
ncbi:MAG TPA: hypothetical protein VGZ32_18340 [Actinocrinis sp.]|uniref:hypothetical protein n=1 Tax=Actinocrinis sp. TaxID=1920516 RepID=UPI002DDD642C|nr:hypothetical protein [Actinocrinis sp.]HEV3172312.1 hypothetical protein [Actinocrinis sp.]